jgi:predicted  nucleic acid-binding Zn-ribbon protein
MKVARYTQALLIPLVISAAAGCEDGTRQQLENEIMLMQERLVELETQVADSQDHANRLSTAVEQLDAYVRDVETEVIELSAHVPRDLLVNVEATVGNAKTKLAEVRARTGALGNALRPAYAEE